MTSRIKKIPFPTRGLCVRRHKKMHRARIEKSTETIDVVQENLTFVMFLTSFETNGLYNQIMPLSQSEPC